MLIGVEKYRKRIFTTHTHTLNHKNHKCEETAVKMVQPLSQGPKASTCVLKTVI